MLRKNTVPQGINRTAAHFDDGGMLAGALHPAWRLWSAAIAGRYMVSIIFKSFES